MVTCSYISEKSAALQSSFLSVLAHIAYISPKKAQQRLPVVPHLILNRQPSPNPFENLLGKRLQDWDTMPEFDGNCSTFDKRVSGAAERAGATSDEDDEGC